jgi:hypothetical protein
MEPVTKNKLSILFGRLGITHNLTDPVLHSCNNYLFDNAGLLAVEEEELIEAVKYLKDLIYYNELETIDDIIVYFENKKKNLSAFISNVLNNEGRDAITVNNAGGAFLQWNGGGVKADPQDEFYKICVRDQETNPTIT